MEAAEMGGDLFNQRTRNLVELLPHALRRIRGIMAQSMAAEDEAVRLMLNLNSRLIVRREEGNPLAEFGDGGC